MHPRQFAFERPRKTKAEPLGQPDLLRQHGSFGTQQAADPGLLRKIAVAGIAVVNGSRHQRALMMVRGAISAPQHLRESAHGAVVRMAPPADIRELAGGLADAA